MFIVSLVEFSKRVQNEISAKVMPKLQNFTRGVSGHFFRTAVRILQCHFRQHEHQSHGKA
jgi:hypothetical protein